MTITPMPVAKVQEAAKLLGQALCDRVPHLVDVAFRANDQRQFELWVIVDAPEAVGSNAIPSTFQGFEVHKAITTITSGEEGTNVTASGDTQRKRVSSGYTFTLKHLKP
jgi:hypothetical protein